MEPVKGGQAGGSRGGRGGYDNRGGRGGYDRGNQRQDQFFKDKF